MELPALGNFQNAYGSLTAAQFAAQIAGSAEFTAGHAGQSNAAYVDSLFHAGLGRPAEAGGSAFWAGLLDSGGASRGDVLLSIATAGEAAAHLTRDLSG